LDDDVDSARLLYIEVSVLLGAIMSFFWGIYWHSQPEAYLQMMGTFIMLAASSLISLWIIIRIQQRFNVPLLSRIRELAFIGAGTLLVVDGFFLKNIPYILTVNSYEITIGIVVGAILILVSLVEVFTKSDSS